MQLNEKQADQVRPLIKVLQLICFAMIGGVLVVTTLFGFIADWNNLSTDMTLLAMVGAGLAAVLVAQSTVLPGIIAAVSAKSVGTDKNDDPLKKLMTIFQNKTIVRFALLEGAAFANATLFKIDNEHVRHDRRIAESQSLT